MNCLNLVLFGRFGNGIRSHFSAEKRAHANRKNAYRRCVAYVPGLRDIYNHTVRG